MNQIRMETIDASPDTDAPPATRATPRDRSAWRVGCIATAALVISIAAPFGEDALLDSLNIRTPTARRLAEATQLASQSAQRSDELAGQLAAATLQLAKQQTQVNVATRRIEAGETLVHNMALAQLGAAVRRPGPYDLELAMVRASGDTPADWAPLLKTIESYAATGVPGIPQLQRDFVTLRARIDWNEAGSIPMAWMNRLIAWPRAAISPQEPAPQAASPQAGGTSPPDPASGLVSDTATALGKDNLAAAVAIARQVGGIGRELLSDWVEDAEARVALDDLARRINDLVVQRAGRTGAKSDH